MAAKMVELKTAVLAKLQDPTQHPHVETMLQHCRVAIHQTRQGRRLRFGFTHVRNRVPQEQLFSGIETAATVIAAAVEQCVEDATEAHTQAPAATVADGAETEAAAAAVAAVPGAAASGGGATTATVGPRASAAAALAALGLPDIAAPDVLGGAAGAAAGAAVAAAQVAGEVERAADALGLPAGELFAVLAAVEAATAAPASCLRFLAFDYRRLRRACGAGDAALVRAWMEGVAARLGPDGCGGSG